MQPEPKQLPPQDLDAERSCLGAVMLYANALPVVMQHVTATDFYMPAHRLVFEAICKMWDRAEPIDIVTLRKELDRNPKTSTYIPSDKLTDFLVEMGESVPSHVNAESYARIVAEMSRRRDLIALAERTNAHARDLAKPWDDTKAIVEGEVMRLARPSRDTSDPEPIGNILSEVFASIVSGDGIKGLQTGFSTLDDMLCGFHEGELIIVAGRPAMGKTAYGMELAKRIAHRGDPVAFFSLEMPKSALVQRLLCNLAAVDLQRVRHGWLSKNECQTLKLWVDSLEKAPLVIDDTMYLTIPELRSLLRQMVAKHRIKIAFVDYLQLMRAPIADSRQEAVAEISRNLKAIARELKIPLVVLAQLKRGMEGRSDKRPTMSDLRESGAIEQDADVVMLLHREEYYLRDKCPEELRGVAEVIVDKQRNGPTGIIKFAFDAQFTRFSTLAEVDIARADAAQAAIEQARRDEAPLLADLPEKQADEGDEIPF